MRKNSQHPIFSICLIVYAFLCSGVVAGNDAKLAVFRDCGAQDGCPEMVVVPAGSNVLLGSDNDEAGRIGNEAQHTVSIKSFAIGRYEVRVAEYLSCVNDRVCAPPEWLDPKSEHHIHDGTSRYYKNIEPFVTGKDRPIVGVSYRDARTFVKWLSDKTGKNYRLPSEREWEYSARAGTTTAYPWGGSVRPSGRNAQANCRGCGSDDDAKGASKVGSYPANAWGIHDMNGNVWEWAADFYCENYALVPPGVVRRTDDCPDKDDNDLHVLRGGSSFYDADKARSASRLRNYSTFKNFSVGFRVVRDL